MLSLFTLFQTWLLKKKNKIRCLFSRLDMRAHRENATSLIRIQHGKQGESRIKCSVQPQNPSDARFGANYMPDPNEIMQIRRREILRASGEVRAVSS